MSTNKMLSLDDYENLSDDMLEKMLAANVEHELDLPDGSKQLIKAEHIRQLIESILRVHEYQKALAAAQHDVDEAKKRIEKDATKK